MSMSKDEMKAKVVKAFSDRMGEFVLLKKAAETFLTNVMGDVKDVVTELPDVKDAVDMAIDIADDMTSTGLIDAIDAPIAKHVVAKLIGLKVQAWWTSLRAKILAIG